jgi:hypothetical protein
MLRKKGQNIAEYVILVALIIAAAAAMQVYLRRGLQGRMADAVDFNVGLDMVGTGNNTSAILEFTTKQYEPYYQKSAANVTSDMGYSDKIAARSAINRTDINQTTIRAAQSYEEQSAYTGNGTVRE